jgi:hypothetical protein
LLRHYGLTPGHLVEAAERVLTRKRYARVAA